MIDPTSILFFLGTCGLIGIGGMGLLILIGLAIIIHGDEGRRR